MPGMKSRFSRRSVGANMHIRVQTEDFEVGSLYDALAEKSQKTGAVAMFTGRVRDLNQSNSVNELFLEHYPGMTEKVLLSIAEEATRRFSLNGITVIHRVGQLKPADNIVFVGCAAMHREDAFLACQYTMDRLKTEAPFWKKESSDRGTHWLGSNPKDRRARERWD